MIRNISILNFKSISEQSFELGQVNVVIGENGCGKTNALEAIAFAAAASNGSLNQGILGSHLRYVSPEFMLPAFELTENKEDTPSMISISVLEEKGIARNIHAFYNREEKCWENIGGVVEDLNVLKVLHASRSLDPELLQEVLSAASADESVLKAIDEMDIHTVYEKAPMLLSELKKIVVEKPSLNTFMIYSPEESKLRRFSDDNQQIPLGHGGEGLFQYLKELQKEDKNTFEKIVESISLLDWVDGVQIPDDLLSNEYKLLIGDRYLREQLHYFDQRSANEGFLFLLFYMTLFQSKETPAFFAIDNIESSFNPKLCTKLMRTLVRLAKENNKQVILTTHSPFILDGLDLSDEEQRLFVARRNRDGHTQLKRINSVENMSMRLSEVWMKGMIGGLPDNF